MTRVTVKSRIKQLLSDKGPLDTNEVALTLRLERNVAGASLYQMLLKGEVQRKKPKIDGAGGQEANIWRIKPL